MTSSSPPGGAALWVLDMLACLWGVALCFAGRGFLDAPSPCVGAASGRPGRTRPHLAGPESLRGVPARQGQGPFLFLRKKKRSFTPKKKRGPVYGRLVVENGGLRLSALFGDHSRPLRPCHGGTGTGCGSIHPPPAGASPKAEYGSALRGARRFTLWGATTRRAIPLCRGGQWPPAACGCRSQEGVLMPRSSRE